MKEGSLYEAANATLVHHINQALRAHKLFQRDKDYIVRNDEVVIVDEFTGRMMPGRRYSEGLHQALEAKEGVTVQPENVTLASITFQNYFRLYKKLAGMTGTAATEADEFAEIYKLVVVEIPTHRPIARLDEDDEVYRTGDEKMRAVVREIEAANAKMQPMLVGTTSIEKSELLGEVLERAGYKKIDFAKPDALKALYAAARAGKPSKNFAILNARHHEQEAFIVAEAGVPGAITIATNMAGRGTDIQLGGNVEMRVKQEIDPAAPPEAREAQEAVDPRRSRGFQAEGDRRRRPLHHRHRAARKPPHRQPAARTVRPAGRPGPVEVLPVPAGRSHAHFRRRAHGCDAQAARAQGRRGDRPSVDQQGAGEGAAEGRGAQLRHAQEHSQVRQRDERPAQGHLRGPAPDDGVRIRSKSTIEDMRTGVIDDVVAKHIPHDAYPEAWDIAGLKSEVLNKLNLDLPVDEWAKEEGIADEEVATRLHAAASDAYAQRIQRNTPEAMRYVEKQVILQSLDHLWRDHLVTLDHLRQVIGWRGMAQRDPLNEYKSEAFELFPRVDHPVARSRHRPNVAGRSAVPATRAPPPPMQYQHLDPATGENEFPFAPLSEPIGAAFQAATSGLAVADRDPKNPATWGRVGRNEPCPCGSGKKFKHCHGQVA